MKGKITIEFDILFSADNKAYKIKRRAKFLNKETGEINEAIDVDLICKLIGFDFDTEQIINTINNTYQLNVADIIVKPR